MPLLHRPVTDNGPARHAVTPRQRRMRIQMSFAPYLDDKPSFGTSSMYAASSSTKVTFLAKFKHRW